MIFTRHEVGIVIIAGALLAGCTSSASLPGQSAGSGDIQTLSTHAVGYDASPPSCKGQKNSKDYSQSQAQGLSAKGGSACVPLFDKWGGAIRYPGGAGGELTVISSTTAYDIDFPPSTNAEFYLQLGFSENVTFNTTLAGGASLAGPGLKVKASYTIEGARAMGSLWESLPDCYTTASKGKYGAMIGGLGYPLKSGGFGPSSGAVIMVYPGKLSGTKC